MKKYKAILFDMDGTLLPMNMEEFTSGYFKFLAKKLAPFNLPFEKLVAAIWEGTGAMVKNDGSKKNEEVFWERFLNIFPDLPKEEVIAACNEFYGREFNEAKIFTAPNPLVKQAVKIAREKADLVVLATNPLFPMSGQETRMGWIGLSKADFDLITSYEIDCYCKPNPAYFTSICERLDISPSDCLMIGNDEQEDMYACTVAGMDGYLVSDCMIKSEKHPWDGNKGTFEDLINMLENL